MKDKKSIWKHLKAWVDGEEVILNADKYIATRTPKEKIDWKKYFSVQNVKENKETMQY